jgi:hypothetical protein
MLSLAVCKKILNNGNQKYKDDEVKQIREFLYMVAKLESENEENNNELKD